MLGYYKGVLYALCVSTFVTLGLGAFDINSKNNVAVYYVRFLYLDVNVPCHTNPMHRAKGTTRNP